jgi:hypothetical protein
MILIKPKVKAVAKESFNNWLKENGKLGGQNKIPRLSNDRSILEQIAKNSEFI